MRLRITYHVRYRRFTDGNFHGTNRYGGGAQPGTVFRITPGGALTTIYNGQNRNRGQWVKSAITLTILLRPIAGVKAISHNY